MKTMPIIFSRVSPVMLNMCAYPPRSVDPLHLEKSVGVGVVAACNLLPLQF